MESLPLDPRSSLELDPRSTALIVIDLQRGILVRTTAPHRSADVLARTVQIADQCRRAGRLVVLVHVAFSPDGRDRLTPRVDSPMVSTSPIPPDFAVIAPELGPREGDLVITKRHWGAFHGTELDLQLRRRGIRTLLLTGIATNFGVESTARGAYERGYDQVFVEDAMASFAEEAHRFAVSTILPRLGRVRSTEEVLGALRH
jgi:nicotinamidase-related amidase